MKTHEHSMTDIIGLNTELDVIFNDISTLKEEVVRLTKKLNGR